MKQAKKMSTETLVLGAVLTALVAVLQFMGAFIRLGPFSISLVLIPIVIGAATCGVTVGTWLGFVFGVSVLASGDANLFFSVNAIGTVLTVLVKGAGCGFLSGLAYKGVKALSDRHSKRAVERIKKENGLCFDCEKGVYNYISRNNKYVAVLAAAIVCPLANTGIFLLGCGIFFMDTIREWAFAAMLGDNVVQYVIFVLVGGNFLFEIGTNVILSPVVVKLLSLKDKR